MVEHPGAVAAVPVVDGSERAGGPVRPPMALGIRALLLEIPAGKLDVPGEDPDDRHAPGAGRGDQQRAGRLVKLATFWNSPGFSTELTHVYIALDLSRCDRPEAAKEEEQDMTIERFPSPISAGSSPAARSPTPRRSSALTLAERYLAAEAARMSAEPTPLRLTRVPEPIARPLVVGVPTERRSTSTGCRSRPTASRSLSTTAPPS